jgi:hypothetical protein
MDLVFVFIVPVVNYSKQASKQEFLYQSLDGIIITFALFVTALLLWLVQRVGSGGDAPMSGETLAPENCGDVPQVPMVTSSSDPVG